MPARTTDINGISLDLETLIVRSMTYDKKGRTQKKAQKANGNWILILIFGLLLDVEYVE